MDLAFATGHGPALLTDLEGRGPLVRDEDVVAFGFRDGEEQARYGSQPLPPAMRAFDLPTVRRHRRRGGGARGGRAPDARPSSTASSSTSTPTCLRRRDHAGRRLSPARRAVGRRAAHVLRIAVASGRRSAWRSRSTTRRSTPTARPGARSPTRSSRGSRCHGGLDGCCKLYQYTHTLVLSPNSRPSSMDITINVTDGVPIYRQIVNQVKYLVASGLLQPGEELPPIRTLALQLKVTPNTIVKAYGELEIAGVVHIAPRLGHVRIGRASAAGAPGAAPHHRAAHRCPAGRGAPVELHRGRHPPDGPRTQSGHGSRDHRRTGGRGEIAWDR